jgi:hypothetical protein
MPSSETSVHICQAFDGMSLRIVVLITKDYDDGIFVDYLMTLSVIGGLTARVRFPVVQDFSIRGPDRLWRLPILLSNGYWGYFPGGKAVGA